jgi:hypothetical protein
MSHSLTGVGYKVTTPLPRFSRTTPISANSARLGGGIWCIGSAVTVVNTILWGNKAVKGPEIWLGVAFTQATLTISHSDVEGGQELVYMQSGSILKWGLGMIDARPEFVSVQEGDLHLTWDSPCRNAGDDLAGVGVEDFEGDRRIAFGGIDMGADEFYYHLYSIDDVFPGSQIDINVVGAPGFPVLLALGSGIQEPPQSTSYGNLWLNLPPAKSWQIGTIPGTGILTHNATVPFGWVSGSQHPFQALVGLWGGANTKLTNLMVPDIDFYRPPLVVVPDDKLTIQEAIEYVSSDGVVIVKPGSYVENVDFLGKTITVRSQKGAAVTVIDGNQAGSVVSFRSFEDENSVLQGFTITNGSAAFGGGVHCHDFTSPTVIDNVITANTADNGGAIGCYFSSSPTIAGNTINGNSAADDGGGICCYHSFATITNNMISNNSAYHGGGIHFFDSTVTISNNTIALNSASIHGGGISCFYESTLTIANTILWQNTATCGPQISLGYRWYPCTVNIGHSDVEGGRISVHIEPGTTLNWGPGMINANPLFVTGPSGDCYLSQIPAGQPIDSPCLDAGDPLSNVIRGTTRTDEVQDTGVVDIGYHHPLP